MTKTAKHIKDLEVGDRVVTSIGTGTITSVEPVSFIETAGSGPAVVVAWEVNGLNAHHVCGGLDKIEMAD